MKHVKNKFKELLSNSLLIMIGFVALVALIGNTFTFGLFPYLYNLTKRNTAKEVARQLNVYKSLGGTIDTFNVKKDYIYELNKIKTISEETTKLLFSIKEKGGKATIEQKEMLIRIVDELENAIT